MPLLTPATRQTEADPLVGWPGRLSRLDREMSGTHHLECAAPLLTWR